MNLAFGKYTFNGKGEIPRCTARFCPLPRGIDGEQDHLSPCPQHLRERIEIARRAGVPIVLAYIDYGKKRIGLDREFTPTGDIEADMNEIKRYYMQFEGKNKNNFITGLE